MINREVFWSIHRLHETQGLTPGQIAAQLALAEGTVRRRLAQPGFEARKQREVERLLDEYGPRIGTWLAEFPYSAAQIFQRLREDGYQGSYRTVRRYVNQLRPPVREAFLPLSFAPGEALQVDFGACGFIPCGQTTRRLSVLLGTLCHSRLLAGVFFLSERQEHFLEGLRLILEQIGGVPARIISDNLKSAVLHHGRHGHVEFHPRYADFAGHYGFEPVACRPGRPQEKGIDENAIGYLKKNLTAGRQFHSLAEANTALRHWLETIANVRRHAATGETPLARFERDEKPALRPLPAVPFDCAATESRRADTRCRFWFDGNAYSVPQKCVGQAVTLKATPDAVRVYLHEDLVVRHLRSYDRKQEIIAPDHYQEIKAERRRAREQNLSRDFLALGPAAAAFLAGLEEKQLNPRHHLRKILALAEMYGPAPVAAAMTDAVTFAACRSEYVEHLVLHRRRNHNPAGGVLHVPRAGDLLDLRVTPPDMNIYQANSSTPNPENPA
jgi:transposase